MILVTLFGIDMKKLVIILLGIIILVSCKKDYINKTDGIWEIKSTHLISKVLPIESFEIDDIDSRATYSGAIIDNHERIDWEIGDDVLLYSDEARTVNGDNYAKYSIVDISSNGKYSIASIAPIGDWLYWPNTNKCKLYGAYPSNISTNEGNAIYAIPEIQSKESTIYNCAALLGYLNTTLPENNIIHMPFYPGWTAYQLIYKLRDVELFDVENQKFRYNWRTYEGEVYYNIKLEEIELNSCTLYANNISGNVTAKIVNDNWNFASDSGNSQVIYKYENDILPQGQLDTISCIFATPINHENLKVEFKFTCKYRIISVYGAYVNGRLRENITPQPSMVGDELISDEITNTLKTNKTFNKCKKHRFINLVLPIV